MVLFGTNNNRDAKSRDGCNAGKNRAFQCVVSTVERASREGKEANNKDFSVLETAVKGARQEHVKGRHVRDGRDENRRERDDSKREHEHARLPSSGVRDRLPNPTAAPCFAQPGLDDARRRTVVCEKRNRRRDLW